jgi:hypothetical protein
MILRPMPTLDDAIDHLEHLRARMQQDDVLWRSLGKSVQAGELEVRDVLLAMLKRMAETSSFAMHELDEQLAVLRTQRDTPVAPPSPAMRERGGLAPLRLVRDGCECDTEPAPPPSTNGAEAPLRIRGVHFDGEHDQLFQGPLHLDGGRPRFFKAGDFHATVTTPPRALMLAERAFRWIAAIVEWCSSLGRLSALAMQALSGHTPSLVAMRAELAAGQIRSDGGIGRLDTGGGSSDQASSAREWIPRPEIVTLMITRTYRMRILGQDPVMPAFHEGSGVR